MMIVDPLAALISILTMGLLITFGHDTWLHLTGQHPADEEAAIEAEIDEAIARLESWANHPSQEQ